MTYRGGFALGRVILAVSGRFHSAVLIRRELVLVHFVHQHHLGIGIHSHGAAVLGTTKVTTHDFNQNACKTLAGTRLAG